jgi:ABC-type phosphate transport system auxiliary subunit
MSNMIAQEAPLGRKARRQRFTFQKVDELSGEIVSLRAKLNASEAALCASECDLQALQENLTEQVGKLQSHAAELEADLLGRRLEAERLESNNQFLKDELDQVKVQKELLKSDYDRLAAELKAIKVERARNDIEAWRAVGHNPPWKRCYQRIEGLFRKERDDSPALGFDNLLRLPPP